MPPQVSPYLLVTLAPLFWSGNFVLGRALGDAIPPIALSFWRWALALLIMLPFTFARVRAQRGLIRRHLGVLGLLGLLGVANFNTFVYLGLQSTTATNALLLQSATPVLIVGLSFLLFDEGVAMRQVLGILVSLAGVGVIVLEGEPARIAGLALNRGDLWVLAAVLTWALYSVCLRWRPAGIDPLAFLTLTIVVAVFALLPLYLWELGRVGAFAVNAVTLSAIGYVAVFPSVLAYIFWNRAVAELGANRTGQFLHLMPVFGTLLAMLTLGERLRGFHLWGIALIAAGIWLATAGGRRPQREAVG